MKMACYARCPVLLIGDIDRGGVFASLVGHMELFTPQERRLVAAFVINKFRGDASLLSSGIDFLRERTGVPTLGVVPLLEDWRSDEEDSLGIEDRRQHSKPSAPLQIAVPSLPFLSNYTDFEALADEPDVNVRYVSEAGGARRRCGDRPARQQEHDRRSCLAARARSGGGGASGGRCRHARARHLRRLPDARPPHQRPRARRVRGRVRRGPRPPRRGDHLQRREAHGPGRGRAAGGLRLNGRRPCGGWL